MKSITSVRMKTESPMHIATRIQGQRKLAKGYDRQLPAWEIACFYFAFEPMHFAYIMSILPFIRLDERTLIAKICGICNPKSHILQNLVFLRLQNHLFRKKNQWR